MWYVVVQERVEEVVGLYNEKLAGCLGMMLELDGERRMEV